MKYLIGFLIIFAVGGLYYFVPLGSCENTRQWWERFPGANAELTAYERNCGATAGYSTIVYITPLVDRGGEGNKELIVLSGKTNIKLIWHSATQLEIDYKGGIPSKSENKWNGISVSYKEVK